MARDKRGLPVCFPIKDFNETSILEFVSYDLESPKYDVEECQQRDMTYSGPLR